MKKTKSMLYPLLIIGSVSLAMFSCKKDDTTKSNNSTSSGIVFNPNKTYGTMTDIDGNTYKTITIGTQTWMAENLKVTKYNDSTAIPNVTDATAWSSLTTGAVCTYNNTTNADTINTYGRLYNWYAVNTAKLCPTGWHVPSDSEWTILNNYLLTNVGGKLKETGTTHWATPNTGATNETGFTALPGGFRDYNGTFNIIGYFGFWWSSTEGSTGYASYRNLFSSGSGLDYGGNYLVSGFSVRCLRD